jgi:hypothetical protein
MGYVVGETEGLSTWAKCRRLVGQSYYDDGAGEYVNRDLPDVNEIHNTVFYSHSVAPWFRTEKGKGWLRGAFVPNIPPSPFLAYYPSFAFTRIYYISGDGFRDFYAAGLTSDVQGELLGEEVLVDSGAFQIDVEAFAATLPSSGQQLPAVYDGPINGPVYEVGKMSAV